MQVRYKHTGKIYAMKVLDKKSIIENEELDHAISEKNILQNLVHPFLVQLYFAFQTPDKICLVMDFINGGDIFYHLQVQFQSLVIVLNECVRRMMRDFHRKELDSMPLRL
jgi:serine/threonine protein kinase